MCGRTAIAVRWFLKILLGSVCLAYLVSDHKINGWNENPILGRQRSPTGWCFWFALSNDMCMEDCRMHFVGARIVIPNNTANSRYKSAFSLPTCIRCLFNFGYTDGALVIKNNSLLWKNDRLPDHAVWFKSHPAISNVIVTHSRSGTPRINIDLGASCIRWQRTRIYQSDFKGQGNCALGDLNRASYPYVRSYPSSFGGEADVTLTGHDFSLSLCDTGLTVADLALPFSDVGLTLVNVGLLAHETGLTAGNPALRQQDYKRRYADNLGNVVILVLGSAAAFIGLFELLAWLEYRRMSRGNHVGVMSLNDAKPDQGSQPSNRQDHLNEASPSESPNTQS